MVLDLLIAAGLKVAATAGAPSAPASNGTVAPFAVTSQARSTCENGRLCKQRLPTTPW